MSDAAAQRGVAAQHAAAEGSTEHIEEMMQVIRASGRAPIERWKPKDQEEEKERALAMKLRIMKKSLSAAQLHEINAMRLKDAEAKKDKVHLEEMMKRITALSRIPVEHREPKYQEEEKETALAKKLRKMKK